MNVTLLGSTLSIDESIIDEPTVEIREQLREYERGDRRSFELTVRFLDGLTGEVMSVMAEIPYGETRTYGELAEQLDSAPVAVGQACGRNPIPVIVPCHRVVGSNGELGGYSAADGVAMKRRLLDFEAHNRTGGTVQTRLPTEDSSP